MRKIGVDHNSTGEDHRMHFIKNRTMESLSPAILCRSVWSCPLVVDAKLSTPIRHRLGNQLSIVSH